jgi:hypothetical protein
MTKRACILLLAAATSCGALAACMTGPANFCDRLVEDRRKLARQIDLAEHTSAAPNSAAGLLMLMALLGGSPEAADFIADYAVQDKQRALSDMCVKQGMLNRTIDRNRCTAEAKANAGLIATTDSAQFDGTYEGQGRTDSWCAPPSLALRIEAGKVSGALRDGGASAVFMVRGQVYDDGEATLWFMRPGGQDYTDDVDARLVGDTLSFTAKLDASPRSCTYRFATARRQEEP